MVGHRFSKLYDTAIHLQLSKELERHHLRTKQHAGFNARHQSFDHILALKANSKEVRHRSSKVFYYFVNFRKPFNPFFRDSLFEQLQDIGISETVITIIMPELSKLDWSSNRSTPEIGTEQKPKTKPDHKTN